MRAFHNDPKVKAKYLKRVIAHQRADELVKGAAGADGRGCAVWCTLDAYDHKRYETELGLPEWLARLEDTLFEGMTLAKSKTWPEVFLKAIKPGVRLDRAKALFMIVVLDSNTARLKAIDRKGFSEHINTAIDQCVLANEQAIAYHKMKRPTEAKRSAAWSAASAAWSARSAARSAAESAAESAAWSAAESAAASAAESAAWSARSAAESAAESAAASAAYDYYADELIKILKAGK